jgi:ATP-dependent Clp protease adaptor protein ClpS
LRFQLECCFDVSKSCPSDAHTDVIDRIVSMATNNPTKPPEIPSHAPVNEPGGTVLLERRTEKVKPPSMYQVLMLNDDYTPMEFVVVVIQEYFGKDLAAATQIMLKIHLDGKGVCGVYPKDIAATKVDQVLEAAHKAGHPLKCISEPIDF